MTRQRANKLKEHTIHKLNHFVEDIEGTFDITTDINVKNKFNYEFPILYALARVH